jgi:hypothetical protein
MQLHEQYRPKTWAEVVGQEKAIAKINALRPRGLAGRAYWISGQSGTGKTTIARLLAREVADPINIDEVDATDLSAARTFLCHVGDSPSPLQPGRETLPGPKVWTASPRRRISGLPKNAAITYGRCSKPSKPVACGSDPGRRLFGQMIAENL